MVRRNVNMLQHLLVCTLIAVCSSNATSESIAEGQEFSYMKGQIESMLTTMKNMKEDNDVLKVQISDILSHFAELMKMLMKRDDPCADVKTAIEYLIKSGPPGPPGPQGVVGRDGRDGRDGDGGMNGLNGRDGLQGLQGPPGERGVDGENGSQGDFGPAGPPGASGGAVYTRWGRTMCGANSTLIYAGFVGGSVWDETGGGVNHQCMVLDAEYNKYTGSMELFSHISGTAYESSTYGIFDDEMRRQDAPCAVCYANSRLSTLMIPGKRTCPHDWHMEYEGYLMSERDVHPHPSTFECFDSEPEYVPGGAGSDAGSVLYFNKPVCDKGVPCPPYVAERAITCVVCTK